MPWKPKRPCSTPRCPGFVVPGRSRCAEHERAAKRAYNASRDPVTTAFYRSSEWLAFRAMILSARPTCECQDARCRHVRWSPTCTQPATVVDHKDDEVRARPDRALDPTNVASLCVGCHNSKTARTTWRPR